MLSKLSFKEKKKPHGFVAYPFSYFKLRRISNGHPTNGGFLSVLVLKGCRLSDLGRTNICFSMWKKKWSHPFGKLTFFKSLWHFGSGLLAAVFNTDKSQTENKAPKPEQFEGEPNNQTVNPSYELQN